MRFQSGRELMLDRLGNEMKYLYTIDNFPRQRETVRGDDGGVILARLARRKSRFRIDALDQRFVLVRHCCCFARVVRFVRLNLLRGAESLHESRTAGECAGAR